MYGGGGEAGGAGRQLAKTEWVKLFHLIRVALLLCVFYIMILGKILHQKGV